MLCGADALCAELEEISVAVDTSSALPEQAVSNGSSMAARMIYDIQRICLLFILFPPPVNMCLMARIWLYIALDQNNITQSDPRNNQLYDNPILLLRCHWDYL